MDHEIYIRSKNTGRYLNAAGAWSGLRSDALKFDTAREAVAHCDRRHLVNIEIVLVRDALIHSSVPLIGNSAAPN